MLLLNWIKRLLRGRVGRSAKNSTPKSADPFVDLFVTRLEERRVLNADWVPLGDVIVDLIDGAATNPIDRSSHSAFDPTPVDGEASESTTEQSRDNAVAMDQPPVSVTLPDNEVRPSALQNAKSPTDDGGAFEVDASDDFNPIRPATVIQDVTNAIESSKSIADSLVPSNDEQSLGDELGSTELDTSNRGTDDRPLVLVRFDDTGNLVISDEGTPIEGSEVGRNGNPSYSADQTLTLSVDSITDDVVLTASHRVLSDGANSAVAEMRFAQSELNGQIQLDLGSGDDTLVVDFLNGNPIPTAGLTLDGGDGGDDALRIVSNGVSATYTPGAVYGDGTIMVGEAKLEFIDLEPIDFDATGGTFNLILPGADDVVDVSNSTLIDGTTPALKISGSSGGIAFENARVRNSEIVIDTTLVDGNDTVTISSANNSHGNTNLTINTGAGADSVLFNGAAIFNGDVSVTTGTIDISQVISTGGGNVSLTATNDVELIGADADVVTGGGSFTVDSDSDDNGSGDFEMSATTSLLGADENIDRFASINPATAAPSYIGPMGFTSLQAVAADAVNGTIYGIDGGTGTLITIDPTTGAGTGVGSLGLGSLGFNIGAAFDPITGTLYGTKGGGGITSELFTVNTSTGAATPVGTLTENIFGLAFDQNTNTLFGSRGDKLYRIDTTTAAVTTVGNTGTIASSNGLAFDPILNALYMTHVATQRLFTIDPLTGAATDQGYMGASRFEGLTVSLEVGSVLAGNGEISITAADVALAGTIAGTGTLTLQPSQTNSTIGVGGGAGTLNIDDSELLVLQDGFSLITVGDATTGTGAVDVDRSSFTDSVTIVGGSLTVSELDAADNDVTLIARTANIAGEPGAGNDVTSSSLSAIAATGVATAVDPLETVVSNFESDGGTGGVHVSNTGGLTIGDIGALVGVSATGGDIDVAANSPLTANEDVVNSGGGDIDLSANGDPPTGELAFVQAVGVGGSPRDVIISPDGKHVYVARSSASAIDVYSRDETTGTLTFVETQFTENSAYGQLNNVFLLSISPDGQHVYTAANTTDPYSVFRRDANTGELEQVAQPTQGLSTPPTRIAVSPDGNHVYATQASTIRRFDRDPSTGVITLVESIVEGIEGDGGIDGLQNAQSIAISPDGENAYVAAGSHSSGTASDFLGVFARDVDGSLTFLEDERAGVSSSDRAVDVAVSPDGQNVYAITRWRSPTEIDAIAVFSRDTSDGGKLNFVQTLRNDSNGITGLIDPVRVSISPDGQHVYVASQKGDGLVVFSRDPSDDGKLTFVEFEQAGFDGTSNPFGPQGISISPDGAFVYTTDTSGSGLIAYERDSGQEHDLTLNANVTATGGNGNITLIAGDEILQTSGIVSAGGAGTIDYNAATATATGSIKTSAGVASGTHASGALVSLAGDVAPGASPGQLVIDGDVTFEGSDEFIVEIDGLTPGSQHDQLRVEGPGRTVTLNNATLSVSLDMGFDPAPGNSFVIINNVDSESTVDGTFSEQPEGSVVAVDGVTFVISYIGGTDDNDVVLTAGAATTTTVSRLGNDIRIEDTDGGDTDDTLTITTDGSDIIISDPTNRIAITGLTTATGDGTNTVRVPFAEPGFTGDIILDLLAGDDVITFDSAFDLGTARGVVVQEGGDTDTVNWEATAPLASLDLTAEAIFLNSGAVDTLLGNQSYHGAVTLGVDTTLNANDVVFNDTVDSATGELNNLTVNAPTTTFGGDIGTATGGELGALTTDDHSGSDVTTIGAQSIEAAGGTIIFNDAVVLTTNTSITDTGGTGVFFRSTVNADLAANNRDLTISAGTGTVDFDQGVGGSETLDELTVTATTINLNGGTVTTTGSQGYNGATFLGADTAITSGGATFNGTLQGSGGVRNLTGRSTSQFLLQGEVGGADMIGVIDLDVGQVGNLGKVGIAAPLSAQGTVTLKATGDVNIGNDTDPAVTTNGNELIIVADSDANGTGNFNLATSGGGDITTSGGNVSVTSADVSLNGTIDGGSGMISFVPSTLNRTIGLGSAPLGQFLLSQGELANLASTSMVTIGQSGSSGAIDINPVNLTTKDYNLTVQGGTISLDQFRLNAGKTLQLNSTGAITDSNADTNNVTAGKFVVTNSTGVGTSGNALETAVNNFEAAGGSGGVYVSNTGALTIGGIGAIDGVSSAGGGINIIALSPLTVDEKVEDTGGGDITLTATDDVDLPEPDTLTINAQVIASGGDVSLSGENITINDSGEALDISAVGAGRIISTATDSTTIGSDVTLVTQDADIELTTDDIDINATALVNAGNAVVDIQTTTIGRAISLGNDVLGQLSLTETEGDRITAGILVIGSATSGQISADGFSPGNVSTLVLRTTADVVEPGVGDATADIEVTNLAIEADDGVDIDVDVTGSLTVNVAETGDVNIADTSVHLTIDDVTTDAGVLSGVITSDGSIDLTATERLKVRKDITAGGGGSISLSAGSVIELEGVTVKTTGGGINVNKQVELRSSSTVTTGTGSGGNITFMNASVKSVGTPLDFTVNAGDGSVRLQGIGSETNDSARIRVLEVTGGSGIRMEGSVFTSATQDFHSDVEINTGPAKFVAEDSAITFDGTITGNPAGPFDMIIDSGTAPTSVAGDIGAGGEIKSVDINGGQVTVDDIQTAVGNLIVTGTVGIALTGSTYKTTGDTVVLTGNVTVQNYVTIDTRDSALGFPDGDVTITGNVNADANNAATDRSFTINALQAGQTGGAVSVGEIGNTTSFDGGVSISGATVSTGDINSSGGAAGEAAGNVDLEGDTVSTGEIDASGADNNSGTAGAGGQVNVATTNGQISISAIDASGGDATDGDADGGAAGSINLTSGDSDSSGDDGILIGGTYRATGGAGFGNGAAGADGTISLNSAADIVDDTLAESSDILGGSLILLSATGVGASDDGDIDTAVSNIEADGGSGEVWISNTGDLEIGGISAQVGVTSNGNISIDAASTIFVSETIDSKGGDVTLDATDDVNINSSIRSDGGMVTVRADNDISFNAAGSIDTESGTATVILTADDDASSAGGITMASGSRIDGTGTIDLDAFDDVALSQMVTQNGEVQITSLGGAITDNADVGDNIDANAAVFRALTGIGSLADDIDADVRDLAATTATGGIHISDDSSTLVITTVDGLAGVSITDSGASGDILIPNQAPGASIGGIEVLQNVSNAGTGDIALSTQDDNDSALLTIEANIEAHGGNILLVSDQDVDFNSSPTVSTTGTGAIQIHAGQDLSLGVLSLASLSGDILDADSYTIETEEGDIELTATIDVNLDIVDADSDDASNAGTVIVTADSDLDGTGAIKDALAGEGANVTGAAAVFRAAGGIMGTADDVDTSVSTLAASNTTSGSIEIDNNVGGLLTSGTVDGLMGVTNTAPGGSIIVTNASPLNVDDDVTANGDVTLTALESTPAATNTNNISVNAGVTVRSTGGDVVFQAGDRISLSNTAIVAAQTGNVTFDSGFDDNDTDGLMALDGTVSAATRITLDLNDQSGATQAATGTITAGELLLLSGAANGSFLLGDSTTNDAGTLAASSEGAIDFRDDNGVTIGTVGTIIGITTSGDHVTINSATDPGGTITVDQAIITNPGTGGGVNISGSVDLNARITAGAGTITLNGNDATGGITVDEDIIASGTIDLDSPNDIIIGATLRTTDPAADIDLSADANDDGAGGVHIQSAGFVDAARNTTIEGSDLTTTGASTDGVRINGDGANDQVTASGDITIRNRTNVPAGADIVIDGRVNATGSGTVSITSLDTIEVSDNLTSAGGVVSVNSAMVLTDDVTVVAGTNATFSSTIDDDAVGATSSILLVTAAGVTRFNADIGATNPIDSVTTNGGGTTEINGNITTSGGTMTFTDAVVLTNDTILIDTGGTGIDFQNTVDSDDTSRALTVNVPSADLMFGGNVGNDSALASVIVQDAQNVTFDGTADVNGAVDVDIDDGNAVAGTFTANGDFSAGSFDLSGTGSNEVFAFNGDVETSDVATGAFMIDNASNVNFADDADVTAETNLTIQNVTAEIQLGANVDFTAEAGDVDLDNSVTLIDLAGTGTNIISARGSDIQLAAVTDSDEVDELEINADGNITVDTILLDEQADVLLDVDLDQNAGGGIFTGYMLQAGRMTFDGTGVDDTFNFNGTVETTHAATGSITINQAGNVNFADNMDVTAETDLTIQNIGTEVQLGTNVDFTAEAGDVDVNNTVSLIDLAGTGINRITARGSNIELAAVSDSGTVDEFELNADDNITLDSVILDNQADVLLDVNLDENGGVGTFSANGLQAGQMTFDGTDTNDTFNFNDSLETTDPLTGTIVIDNASAVNFGDGTGTGDDATAETSFTVRNVSTQVTLNSDADVTAENAALLIVENVAQINFVGAPGTNNVIDGNGDALVQLAPIVSTSPASATINSEGGVTLDAVNINSIFNINFDNDNDTTDAQLTAPQTILANELNVDGGDDDNDDAGFSTTITTDTSDISFNDVDVLDLDGDLTAASDITATDINTKIDLAGNVNLTAQSGDIELDDQVALIELSGAGTNIISARGSDIRLAKLVDTADVVELELNADDSVQLASVTLNNRAAGTLLDINAGDAGPADTTGSVEATGMLTATRATFAAADGIGTIAPLSTTIEDVEAHGGSRGVFITNSQQLTIADLEDGDQVGLTAGNTTSDLPGNIDVRTLAGNLIIDAQINNTVAGGDIQFVASGDLIINDSSLDEDIVVVGSQIRGYAGGAVDVGTDVLIKTATGQVSEKSFEAISATDPSRMDYILHAPVDVGGVNVKADGTAQIEFTFEDPDALNYEFHVDWGDGTLDKYPPLAASGVTQFDGTVTYTVTHQYSGNPNPNDPAANIQYTAFANFDYVPGSTNFAAGTSSNGISFFVNSIGPGSGDLVIGFATGELTVPGEGLFSFVIVSESAIVRVESREEVSVGLFNDAGTNSSDSIEGLEITTGADEEAAQDEEQLYFTIEAVTGEESSPVQLQVKLLDEDRLLDLFKTFPNNVYKIYYKEAGSTMEQLLFRVRILQNKIVPLGGESSESGVPNDPVASHGVDDRLIASQLNVKSISQPSDARVSLPHPSNQASKFESGASRTMAGPQTVDSQSRDPVPANTGQNEILTGSNGRSIEIGATADDRPNFRTPLSGAIVVAGGLITAASQANWRDRVDQAMESGKQVLGKAARLRRRIRK